MDLRVARIKAAVSVKKHGVKRVYAVLKDGTVVMLS